MLIISVHLPKTAGSSFAASLEDAFGTALLRDYADLPVNTPPDRRVQVARENASAIAGRDLSGTACIHGHFLPLKYQSLAAKRDVAFVTWMRDPVERLLSHYYFWQASYDSVSSPALHKQMMEEQWSLERFCLGPEVRNLYGQFLVDFPLERFSFIGITEHYAEDFIFFSNRFLNRLLNPHKVNVSSRNSARHPIAASLRQEIARVHADDIELYRRALEMRRARIPA